MDNWTGGGDTWVGSSIRFTDDYTGSKSHTGGGGGRQWQINMAPVVVTGVYCFKLVVSHFI